MAERRIHPRVSVQAEVWLGQDGVFTRSTERLTNLSIGGAFITARGGYGVGEVLSLRFSLGTQFVTSTVIVRNVVEGEGIGVEFLDLSPENRFRLQSFIATRS